MTTAQLIKKLVATIQEKARGHQLFVVGVTGLDASGKSQIAKLLSDRLVVKKKNVLAVSGDSFQYPREYKEDLREQDWATQHIKRTINFDKIIEEFFKPLQSLPKTLPLHIIDYDTRKIIEQEISLTYPLVVIVESIYLLQKNIVPYLDYKIFLEISIDEALKRAQARQRDLDLYGGKAGVEKKYSTKNFPGYLQFEKLENPKQYADIIVDNNNWQQPVLADT